MTLFHLLYRFSPEIRTDFGRSDEHRWIQRYGFEEHTVGKPDDDAVEDGRNSRRRKYRKVVRERPGLVPSALFHIIGNTVFLRLADVASGLPPYEEQVMLSSMDSEEDATGYSQRSAYNTVFEELKKELAEALKAGSKRLLATYLQTLLAYPDGCTRGETVFNPIHYLPLLERKTGALDQAAPLVGWELPEEFGVLRRLLESRMGRRGKHEFVQVLRLMENFRKEEVYEAVRDALRLGAISFDAVKHLVLCRMEGRPQRLDLELYPYLPRVAVTKTSARDYMALMSGSRR